MHSSEKAFTINYFVETDMPAFKEKKRKEGGKEKAKKEMNSALFCVLIYRENILKWKLFGNDEATKITIYPWLSFPQTQIQNDW